MRAGLLALTIVAACGGSSKPAPTTAEPAPTPTPAADEPQPHAPPAVEPPQPPDGVVHRPPIGVPACDEWIHKMENYLACDKIPPETRDAALQGLDAMIQSWGDPRQWPADVRAATEESCVAASQTMQEGADSLGCAI